jgi:exo-beta-1,3-glucanase (GH17 family)
LKTQPIALRVPLVLLALSLGIIAVIWLWLATPVALARAPIDPAAKLGCVSYGPFRGYQSPWIPGLVVSPEEIAQDLAELAKISECVRIYSIENGLDKVPELASKVGLKVLLGVWLGRDHAKNALLIDETLSLVKDHPDVITAIIVGSEVLLRGEMTASDLRATVRSVRARVNIPVSYADVWEFWLRYPEISGDVDFVTIHVLPYWEDVPVHAEDAAAHVDDIRKRMALVFPGKDILIGEAGWPSQGRMRDGALPSPVNQARFISEILVRAKQENFRVNLFEAYDEPWKRRWEGTVGGYWGLFDQRHRDPKYPHATAITNHPFWRLQLGCGLAFGMSIFGVALAAARRWPSPPRLASWIAVALSATTGGTLLGIAAEKMLYESFGFGGWLAQGALLAAALAIPLLSSAALMSGRALPTFSELIGSEAGRPISVPSRLLGFTLIVFTLIAVVSALALVFDPRSRDFPFASLTVAAVPYGMLTLLNRASSDTRPMAEAIFAGLFTAAALYILFNEGPRNWQALWTSAAYVMLGTALWQVRSITVAGRVPIKAVVLADVALFDQESAAVSSDLRQLHAGANVAARRGRTGSQQQTT